MFFISRFPIISGFRVEWDSRLPPGKRINGIWLAEQEVSANGSVHSKNGQPLSRDPNHVYRIVTREYMAAGHDGFEALKGKPYLIDDENGVIMSSIVRRYLLGMSVSIIYRHHFNTFEGSQYIHTFKIEKENRKPQFLTSSTSHTISKAKQRWLKATEMIVNFERQRASSGHSITEIGDALRVAQHEHMTDVDRFDGAGARGGNTDPGLPKSQVELFVVSPVVDGRLMDVGRV